MIGLVNNTAWSVTFTSVRLLMERSQVIKIRKLPCQVYVPVFVSILVSFSKLHPKLPQKRRWILVAQVVDPYSRVMIDWAYKNAGLQSSTGFPDVTVRWGSEGKEKLMCGGETLIVDPTTSRILLRRL